MRGVPILTDAIGACPDASGRDINAVVGGLLRDLAFAQPTQPKMFGYKRAAAAIFALEQPLAEMIDESGALSKIAGIGPASARVIAEIAESGGSSTVERAIDLSGRRTDVERRRALRQHFLSRAEVRRVPGDSARHRAARLAARPRERVDRPTNWPPWPTLTTSRVR